MGNGNTDEQILTQQKIGAQAKYAYFLLATAAAAIAFSIQQTSNEAIAWSHLPLGAAVGFWAYSFWCGCQWLQLHERAISTNLVAVRFLQESSVVNAGNPELREAMRQQIVAALDKAQDPIVESGQKHWLHQFDALVAGGVSFIAWHVGEMILRRM